MNGKRFRQIDGLVGDAAIVATPPSSKALGQTLNANPIPVSDASSFASAEDR
jgi:hypothetical protein